MMGYRSAAAWWDGTARHVIDREFNRDRANPTVRKPGGVAPGLIIPGEVADVIPSGILRGLPWDFLSPEEQRRVDAAWRDYSVR